MADVHIVRFYDFAYFSGCPIAAAWPNLLCPGNSWSTEMIFFGTMTDVFCGMLNACRCGFAKNTGRGFQVCHIIVCCMY